MNVRAAACAVLLMLATPSPSPAQSAPHVLFDSDPAEAERWFVLHRSYVDRARAGNVPLLFLGDSLTYGWLVDGVGSWKAVFAPLRAEDFGIGGDRTADVIWRIRHGELDGISPRLVVLSIGTNDVSVGRSAADTARGIVECVRMIRAKLPKATVVVVGVLPRGSGGPQTPTRRTLAAVNARIAKIDDGRQIRYFDCSPNFLARDGALKPELFRRDLVHLSSEGYRAWAKALQPKIAALLR